MNAAERVAPDDPARDLLSGRSTGERMSKWRAGWRKAGPMPPVVLVVVDLADANERDMRLLARWLAVQIGRDIGLNWTDAYRYAADLLIKTRAGSVGARTMKEAHVRAMARWGDPRRVAWERLPPIFDTDFWPSPEHEEAEMRAAMTRIHGPGRDRARRAASKRARAARDIAAASKRRRLAAGRD
jgi:hypothetical protein